MSQTLGYRIIHPCLHLKKPPTLSSGGCLAWGGFLRFFPFFWHSDLSGRPSSWKGSLKKIKSFTFSSWISIPLEKEFFVTCGQFKNLFNGTLTFSITYCSAIAALLNSLLSPDLPLGYVHHLFDSRVSIFALHMICKMLDWKTPWIGLLYSWDFTQNLHFWRLAWTQNVVYSIKSWLTSW